MLHASLPTPLHLSLFRAGAPIGERLYSIKAEWDDKVGRFHGHFGFCRPGACLVTCPSTLCVCLQQVAA